MFNLLHTFNIINEVYIKERDQFLLAQKDFVIINYLVGKVMVKSKGNIEPKFAMNIIKAIVYSDLPNVRSVNIESHECAGVVCGHPDHEKNVRIG